MYHLTINIAQPIFFTPVIEIWLKKKKINGFTMRGRSDNPSHHEQMLHHKGLFCSNLRVNLTICHHQKCQILHPTVASPAQLLSHFSVCLTFCWDQKTPVIIQSRLWDEHSLRLYICGSQYNSKNSKLAILQEEIRYISGLPHPWPQLV